MDILNEIKMYTAKELLNEKGLEIVKKAIDYDTLLLIQEVIITHVLNLINSGQSDFKENDVIPVLEFKRKCMEIAFTDSRYKNDAVADSIVNILINNEVDPNDVDEILDTAAYIYEDELV